MRDVEILTTFDRTDQAAARRVVPELLELLGDLVLVHVYQMNDTDWFGRYNESAVNIPVRYPATGVVGASSPYLFLGDDGAVVLGREIYGQPKKSGQPMLEVRGDLFVGTVRRNGIDVVTTTLPYKQRPATVEDMLGLADFRANINLKVVPNIDGTTAIRQLATRRCGNVRMHECWQGDGTVELRPNAQAPVYRLPVREVVTGFYWRVDFALEFGAVLHDYLKEA